MPLANFKHSSEELRVSSTIVCDPICNNWEKHDFRELQHFLLFLGGMESSGQQQEEENNGEIALQISFTDLSFQKKIKINT